MTTAMPVDELRERVRAWHAVFQGDDTLSLRPVPRRPNEGGGGAAAAVRCCYWLRGATARVARSLNPQASSLRGVAEALVLLHELARIDFAASLDHMREIWSDIPAPPPDSAAPDSRGIGLELTVSTCDDLAPIAERVFGAQLPSDRFRNDYAWIKTKVHWWCATEKRKSALVAYDREAHDARPRTIPVRIVVDITSNEDAFERLLRQLVQSAIVQRLLARDRDGDGDSDSEHAGAIASTRFEIVEVAFHLVATPGVNAAALAWLTRLVELGVRIFHLPALSSADLSTLTRLSVAKSLQALLPLEDAAVSLTIQRVDVDERTAKYTPAVLSAVQVSRHVERVHVYLHDDPFFQEDDNSEHDDGEENEDIQAVVTLWRWLAYTLFSRHAQHRVEHVTLDVHCFEERSLGAMENILQAENPLAALFSPMATAFQDNRRIAASRFYVDDPHEIATDVEHTVRTPEPMYVRVIDRAAFEGVVWWRVLLPGCGEVWVHEVDAVEVAPEAVGADGLAEPQGPIHIELEGLLTSGLAVTISLFRLLHDRVGSIGVNTFDNDDILDVSDWTLNVLRACPNLKRLDLWQNVEITRLLSIAEAAKDGYATLRSLSLDQTYDAESSDIIPFFEVLCDPHHPLTKRLEGFSFCVSNSQGPASNFVVVWKRMLRLNRTLHSIYLFLRGPMWDRDIEDEQVAIRTGPLPLGGKLAFLSVVQGAKDLNRARSKLDTGVLSIIFAFAAQHRLRRVTIDG